MKRFKSNGDGTVTDGRTGLMWVKDGKSVGCNNGERLDWKSAIKFCKELAFAGHKDWRLPNANELQTIIDYGKYSPAINTDFTNTVNSGYWTDTPCLTVPGTYAWYVYFGNGSVETSYQFNTNYVRPVRGIIPPGTLNPPIKKHGGIKQKRKGIKNERKSS